MYFSNQPILRDFDRFLDYLGKSAKLELTKDKGYLRSADLLALNEQMHFRLSVFNPKSQQPAFALLNTFFHIVRVSQLALVKKDVLAKQSTLSISEDRVRQYDALSDDEKYFFLLESFWCFVNWEEAYDCRAFWEIHFYLELCKMPVGEPIRIADRNLKRGGKMNGPMEVFHPEVFQAFGLLDLNWDKKLEKRPTKYSFPYESVVLSGLGKAILPLLMEQRNHVFWGNLDPYMSNEMNKRIYGVVSENEDTDTPNINPFAASADESDMADLPYETTFSAAFVAAFPELNIQERLFPIVRPFVGGRYTLRISLNPQCYREIAISAEATLDDLHEVIQDLFDFDNDHLYVFYMDGVTSIHGEAYSDPRGEFDDYKPADVFKIGELGLYQGREFLYVFDFGDNWQFSVLVLGIEPKPIKGADCKLLKSVGKAPEQYPEW